MIFRFRVCRYNDAADTAQGWVVAPSEAHARLMLGDASYFQRMPCQDKLGLLAGTIVLTLSNLAI